METIAALLAELFVLLFLFAAAVVLFPFVFAFVVYAVYGVAFLALLFA